MLKKVKYVLPATMIDMGGFPVKQAIPTQKVAQLDPFLLLHHAKVKPLRHQKATAQGIGPHPHRGFSPVTFVIQGEIHHRDSRGNNQIAKVGDVQWLHAGMGIIHSERPTEEVISSHGQQEIIQLWINSPADRKMKIPEYQYLPTATMPYFHSNDHKIRNKLIAGDYNKQEGKINTESPMLIIWGEAVTDGTQSITVPERYNSMLYLVKGQMRIKGYGPVEAEHLVIFDSINSELGEAEITMSFSQESVFLLLCGAPINEPVVQQGPFVMNTQTEIMQAMRDYQLGKMGILIED